MEYEEVSNLSWASETNDAISMDVVFKGEGLFPFCAVHNDTTPHGRELFARAVAGDFGPIAAYEPEVLPIYVPISITKAQGKAVLIQASVWAEVAAMVSAIEDPTEKALALVALNDTNDWLRDSVFLNDMAARIGLTQLQLDDMFIFGSQINL